MLEFVKKNRLAIVVVAIVAALGTAYLTFSLASTPEEFAQETLRSTRNLDEFQEVAATESKGFLTYTHPDTYQFMARFPQGWKVFNYAPQNPSFPATDTQFRSPDVVMSGDNHDSEVSLDAGSLIEVTAAKNEAFTLVDQFKEQLGANLASSNKLNVDGQPALQYQLVGEPEREDGSKILTTLFKNGVQYTISLVSSSESPTAQQLLIYKNFLNGFKIGT